MSNKPDHPVSPDPGVAGPAAGRPAEAALAALAELLLAMAASPALAEIYSNRRTQTPIAPYTEERKKRTGRRRKRRPSREPLD